VIKVKGFTPHPKQKLIIDSILGGEEKHHIVSVGRQMGKSLMGLNLLLYWGINNSPCKILWVSPVYSQTTKVQKELEKAISPSGFIKSCNYSENFMELNNGTEIYFRSAERYDNLRGYTFDYGILDEAAYMKEETWTEAVRPTMAVKGKKVLFLSTPKGKNWFYDLYMLGDHIDYVNYKSYKGSSFDTPYITEEEINDARKTLPEGVFKQEYLAEFLDGGGEVFKDLDLHTFDNYPISKGHIFAGIDLGRHEDYSVITFMDSDGNVIDIYRTNQKEWKYIIMDFIDLLRDNKATALMEVNSIGDVIFEDMKGKYKDLHPFTTTNKSKQEVIEGLILDLNEGSVGIPSKKLFRPLYNELESFTYNYNPSTRSIKYGHPTGLHDDCVISLALANYCRKTKIKRGKYTYMI
jgi:hypothetical protein